MTWAAILLDGADPLTSTYCWGNCPSIVDLPNLAEATLDGRQICSQIVPLVADGMSIGTLAIGRKRHDVELLPEVGQLIATLAPLVATGLQSALLVRRLEIQVAALEDRG